MLTDIQIDLLSKDIKQNLFKGQVVVSVDKYKEVDYLFTYYNTTKITLSSSEKTKLPKIAITTLLNSIPVFELSQIKHDYYACAIYDRLIALESAQIIIDLSIQEFIEMIDFCSKRALISWSTRFKLIGNIEKFSSEQTPAETLFGTGVKIEREDIEKALVL